MGVYVSGINMPEGEGSKLVLQIFPNGEVYDGHGIRLGIANWAKAVSIPPHGDLIDRDAIPYNKIMLENDDFYYGVTKPYIDRMPIIIPAEREKE